MSKDIMQDKAGNAAEKNLVSKLIRRHKGRDERK